ncbi:MAG TPA: GHMP kinase [Candidatus Alectryocaccomicrobium excrementavium]|uniref:GHMP kinase n=1 Tax=Candidatus Alectryocaccomicrobium excrementavium TaxID=2840668 RepID=A0A9D1FZ81_9FIRM|nr:GHMP kinase [Candidatus Alectryocaccomicrobium excrementavium]
MRCAEYYEREYGRAPEAVAFAPYRVCPIGAHVDHNLGKTMGFAIDRGVRIAYAAEESGAVEVRSLQFPGCAHWRVDGVPPERLGDWADHLRGATLALGRRFALRAGLRAVIEGELPIGGLSSSAAVILAFLSALCAVNGIHLSGEDWVSIAREAENQYVGVACGKLDQSCEVYGKKGQLLYMDFQEGSFSRIPPAAGMKPFVIAVFFSGITRALAGGGYNTRVDELRGAAYALKAYAGMEYGAFAQTNMRDVPLEVYQAHGARLPEPWRRRAEHWFSEMARVEEGVEAWRRGDLAAFGRLCLASGRSSIENWQTGSAELIQLHEILSRTEGVYGGRFSGAGFKGCCVALVDPALAESAARSVASAYAKAFPALAEAFSAHICHSADGIQP